MSSALRRTLRLLAIGAVALPLLGQGRYNWGPPPTPGKDDFFKNNVAYDGRFTYTRYKYTPSRINWPMRESYFSVDYFWDHDYPRADHHFPTIVDELTTIHARRTESNIFEITDTAFFKYPFAYFCEPGYWTLSDADVKSLRAYLLKGGFLIVDDFRGYHMVNFVDVLHKVFPEAQLIELTSAHPIFHSFFEIDTLPRVPPYGPGPSLYYGVFENNDPNGHMMMIVNFDNDISESWEWSDTGFIPIDLTNEDYKLGVNYLVYAMTH